MAFKNKNMSVIAYANGWTLWLYQTQDDTWPTYLKTIISHPSIH